MHLPAWTLADNGECVGQTWRVRSDSRSPWAWWMIFEPGGNASVADVVAQAGLATMASDAPWGWQADGVMLVEGDLLRRVGQKRN